MDRGSSSRIVLQTVTQEYVLIFIYRVVAGIRVRSRGRRAPLVADSSSTAGRSEAENSGVALPSTVDRVEWRTGALLGGGAA